MKHPVKGLTCHMFPGAAPLPGAPYDEGVVEVVVLVYLENIRLLRVVAHMCMKEREREIIVATA